MPRFFFNVFDDVTALDEEGRELPDLDAARLKAVQGARELICEQIREGRLNLGYHIEIVDEGGDCIATIPFRDVVRLDS